ncbi:MAG: M13 family metallopeptidase [Bacteroidales bacterium]|nr:M13 family metallopeptidase [Bacteroidales bacterium]
MKKTNAIAILFLCIMAAGCGQKAVETTQSKREVFPAIELSNMDTTINPADDFFRYCNNNWLKNNPIPETYSTYSAFHEIGERTELQIQEIIDEALQDKDAKQGSNVQKIRDFYNAGMDTAAINERGYSELLPYFEKIDQVNDKSQLPELVGLLQYDGFGWPLFQAGSYADFKNAERAIMIVFQPELGLPDRDLYLVEETQEMRDKYVEHIANMFQLTGTDSTLATQKAQNVLAFETELAKFSMPLEECLDPTKLYHLKSRQELQSSMPVFNWDNFFDATGAPAFDSLNVGSPDYFTALNGIIQNTDLGTIKDYLRWMVINYSAPSLSEDLVTEDFNFFKKYLYDVEEQNPRWRRVLNKTSDYLGEAIGQLYVEKYFSAEAKERMLNLVGNLRMALRERIKNLDWMSDETKARAIHKLDCYNVKIGYPDKWLDYSSYEVTPDSYFMNIRRGKRFDHERDMAKIGKPVDKGEWDMNPQEVNAYYNPELNEIVFPAGILQPPFFNMDADDAVNYGSIGVTIGHEMTHGFDNMGRMYDEKGNLNNWWTDEDDAKFTERTKQLVKLFDEFELNGLHINGKLTLGENIADLGGLNVAWDAYQMTDEAKANKSIDGFTPAQRFFISYGTTWRRNMRDKALERRIKEDVHSPAEARVNRALGSMPHFYEAFDIPEGSKMYIAPEERAAIW